MNIELTRFFLELGTREEREHRYTYIGYIVDICGCEREKLHFQFFLGFKNRERENKQTEIDSNFKHSFLFRGFVILVLRLRHTIILFNIVIFKPF